MEKKPSESNSQNICEKLCNCLFISPFKSLRRNSHSLQNAAPCANCCPTQPTASVDSGGIVHNAQPRPSPGEKEREKFPVHIPIQDGQEGMKVAPKIGPEPELVQQKEKLKNKAEVAPVAEGVMGSVQGKTVREGEPSQETTGKVKELKRIGTEVINDKITDYISRTKLKIRSMSSFSGGKSGSSK